MWTQVLSFLADPFKRWQELKAAKHAAKVAAQENRARLLSNEQSHNHEWEMAQLEDKDKGLRYLSFSMFVLPFIVAIFSPEHVRDYFEVSMSSIPEWWKQVFVAITGAVWGLASLKNTLPSIIGQSLYKLQQLEARGAATLDSASSGTPKESKQADRTRSRGRPPGKR